jgi:hypothetical protein
LTAGLIGIYFPRIFVAIELLYGICFGGSIELFFRVYLVIGVALLGAMGQALAVTVHYDIVVYNELGLLFVGGSFICHNVVVDDDYTPA